MGIENRNDVKQKASRGNVKGNRAASMAGRHLLMLLPLAPALPGVAWAQAAPPAMFRGGPEHRGVYAASGGTAFAGLVWRVQTAGPVRSSPTVAGDAVYVGSDDGTLYALDRRTGTVRWRRAFAGGVSSTPAAAAGLVFVATTDQCVALDGRDGAERWRVPFGRELGFPWGHESGDRYRSSPVVAGDALVIGAGDGVLRAVDAATGAIRWTHDLGAVIRSSPAVADGIVFVGAADGSVYAVDLATGRRRWRFDTEGRALQSANFGFDRRTVQSSPAVADGRVFIGARDGFFYAIDAVSGKQLWRGDHKVSWINASPAVQGDLTIVGSSDGRFVQAVDVASGSERWRAATGGIVWGSAAVAGGVAYVGDGTGTLYALDVTTGTERWQWRAGGGLFSSPVLADSTIYVGSDDGGVYAIALTAGPALRRAVFWDSTLVAQAFFRGHDPVRRWLADHGYAVLGAFGLAAWLENRVSDGAPSVLVSALDVLPSDVAAPLRRYLDAGGKVVWLGTPPLLWPRRADGSLSLADVDRAATERLLGVRHERGNFDPHGAVPTEAGRQWGLESWWIANWGADPASVTTVLARDDEGLAAAWVRRYVDRPGTGFVRLYGVDWGAAAGRSPSPLSVQIAAELFPR
jgi:outer membrane protein assembly factor BamB